MSSTWKSLATGFVSGVISTGAYALGFHAPAAFLWGASVLYIGYQAWEARKGS